MSNDNEHPNDATVIPKLDSILTVYGGRVKTVSDLEEGYYVLLFDYQDCRAGEEFKQTLKRGVDFTGRGYINDYSVWSNVDGTECYDSFHMPASLVRPATDAEVSAIELRLDGGQ